MGNAKPKERFLMYELFNYADGNDDILSDAGGGNDIRTGMWAQMPYSVSDGPGVFNEEFGINEEIPDVHYENLDDRGYSDKLARAVAGKLGLTAPRYLGGGGNGFAYEINDNLVMKLTTDVSEADAASRLMRGRPVRIATIFNLYKVVDTDEDKSVYVIMQENVQDKPLEKFRKFEADISKISPDGMGYEDILFSIKKPHKFNYEQSLELAKKILTDNPKAGVSETDRQAAYEFLVGMIEIRKELLEFGIKSTDYIAILNLGYKDGVLKFFDTGGYHGVNEPDFGDDDIISLPEDGSAKFTTNDAINQDGFPPYETNDTSPSINNDLDANIAMYENFEDIGNGIGSDNGKWIEIKNGEKILIRAHTRSSYENMSGEIDSFSVWAVNKDGDAVGEAQVKKHNDDFYVRDAETEPNYRGQGVMTAIYDYIEDNGYELKKTERTIRTDAGDSFTKSWKGGKTNEDLEYNHVKGDATDDKYMLSEVVEGGEYQAYHGSETEIKKFSDEFVGAENATDQEGPGIYFTTSLDDARAYGKHIYSVVLRPRKLVDESSHQDVDTNELVELIKTGPDWEMHAQDWAEDPESGIHAAVDSMMQYSENEKDLFQQVWYDFFRYEPLLYVRGMVKLGYDGELINKENGRQHIIVYNPDIIETTNTEVLSEERNKSFGPGSKTVTVKKKCQLGGLGTTSVACNQGDINNLEFGSVNEVVAKTQEEVDRFISNSKVKETVYHGSPVGGIEDFKKPKGGRDDGQVVVSSGLREDAIYFTSNPRLADVYKGKKLNPEFKQEIERRIQIMHDKQMTVRNNRDYDAINDEIEKLRNKLLGEVYGVKLKITNPLIFDGKGKSNSLAGSGWNELEIDLGYKVARGKEAINLIATKSDVAKNYWKYDGIVGKNIIELDSYTNKPDDSNSEYLGNVYAVFSPNQILVLGPELMKDDTPRNDMYFNKLSSVNEEISIDSDFVDGWHRYGLENDGEEVGEIEVSNREKFMVLNKILIHPEHRQRGYADEAMKLLFDYANKNKKIIALTPDNVWGASVEKLKKWYKSLGFTLNKGRNKDFKVRELMIKQPESLELTEYFSSLVPDMNEDIMSIQELPFRKEVEQLGGKIYSVGGAVRDEFLGLESKDLDVLVTGIPLDQLQEILAKYGRVSLEGDSFAVLIFTPEGSTENMDIAIPRTETPTGGGGHQDFDVKGDHELPIEKDLERRDITINAIAKDMDGNIIDPFGGQEDLKNKVIRAVNPDAFNDDPLRMLRAVQFGSRFGGFEIDPDTMQMIKDTAPEIKKIAPERLLIEFDKIINKGNPRVGVELLATTGLFQQIFGNVIQPSQIGRKDFESVKTMAEFLFLMMDGVVQNPSQFFLSRFSNEDAKRSKIFKEMRALELAFSDNEQLTPVQARTIAHNMYLTAPQTLESQVLSPQIKTAAQELLQGKYPKTVNELAINGNDLIQADVPGPERGKVQKSLLINVYADKARNNREELLSLINNRETEIEEAYANYHDLKPTLWNVNDKQVGIDFFVIEYDKWNNKGGVPAHRDASRESVLEFLQNNYEDFSTDKKLNRELYWALTDRDLLGEEEVKKVNYSAVVLDKKSRDNLLKVFAPMIPEGWETIAHHMTIKMGALENGSKAKADLSGKTDITLTVVDYAVDDLVMAVGVDGYETTNEKAHVTIAVNRAEGGKPYLSNKLTDWKPLGFPLTLTGKVTEV